ncbi:MAG: asparaginase [Acidobacteria bacterium]|nr:asparaginase [Acidobacteriota bacterium]MBK7933167.1 asparaginase [Acidobacteriota bacterium]
MNSEILANVIRGETVESIHRGHLIVLDGNGEKVFSLGDPSTVTYFRSSAKAFQAIPFITSGAADAFDFTEEEIALSVASHSGEQRHVEIAEGMLAKVGLAEPDLRCGAHLPFDEAESHRMIAAGEKPTQLHNNCSGKHSAMLAFAKHIGADITSYESPDSRIQRRILRCVSDFTEIPSDLIAIGIDGCAAPNFALPVAAMAKSFVNLLAPSKFPEATRRACSRIVSAMIKYPELIGGSTRLDTMLMRAAPGRFISKVGADGVWLCGVLPSEKWPTGLGIALKIEDGDDYLSRPVVTVALLRHFGVLSKDDLQPISPMPIKNRRGDQVGRVEAML